MAGNGTRWWVTVPGWGGSFCRILHTSLFCLSLPSHHLKDAVELAGLKPTPGTAVDAGRKSALSSPIGISENKRKNQVLCCPWLMLGHGLFEGGGGCWTFQPPAPALPSQGQLGLRHRG